MNSQREFTSEFVINNLSSEKREFLLLKKTRLDVSNLTGVDIVIRGRFIQPKSDGTLVCEPKDRPLHLLITGPSKQNVTLATKRIQELLGMSDEVSSNGANIDTDDDDSVEEEITCGIEAFPLNFGIESKILGTNYENVEFIRKETNATITLRGKGSEFERDDECDEPLYIHVKYNTPGMKKKTRELVLNLIETIQKEFVERYEKYYPCPKKPEVKSIKIFKKPVGPIAKLSSPFHKPTTRVPERPSPFNKSPELVKRSPAPFLKPPDSIQRSPPKEIVPLETKEKDNVDKITIGLSHVPSEFNLKGRIYGPNLIHVKHIEKVSGALILFQGKNEDTEEAPYLLVKYQKPDLKDEARGLIYHLLETVHQDYVTECGVHLPKPTVPRIVPYNKSDDSEKRMKSRLLSESSSPSQVTSRKESPKETVVPPPPPLISRTQTTKLVNHNTTNNLPPIQLTIVQPVPPPVDSTISGLKNLSEPNFNNNISGQTQPHYSHSPVLYGATNSDATPKTSSTPFPKFQYVKKRSHTPEPSTVDISKNISNLKPVLEAFTTSVTEPEVKKKTRQSKDGLNRCLIPLTPIKQSAEVSVPGFVAGSLLQKIQNGRVEPSAFTKDNKPTKNISDTMIFRDNESNQGTEFCETIDSDDDNRSIILLDDDDKFYRPEKPTPVDLDKKVIRRHIGVQTSNQEAWVKSKPIKCQCGNFRQRLIGVRSLAVQTDGYYRY